MIMGGGGGGHFMMWGGRGPGDQPGKRPSLEMYRRLLTFVAPYKGNLFISAVLLVISTALGLVWPQVVRQVIGQVLTLVAGVTTIFLMNWKLALLTLVVAPPIGILGQRLGRQIRDLSRATQDAQAEAVGVLQEAIAEVRVVQAFTREEYEAERFHEKLLFMFRKSMERARITSVMFPLIGFLGFASSIVVLWLGGHEVASGELTTGQLVAFLLY